MNDGGLKARPHAAILAVIWSCDACDEPRWQYRRRENAAHRNVWPLPGCDSAHAMKREEVRRGAI